MAERVARMNPAERERFETRQARIQQAREDKAALRAQRDAARLATKVA